MTNPAKTSIPITTVADILHPQDEVMAAVNNALDEYFIDRIARADTLHPRYGNLISHLRKLAMNGGKRLRPILAISTYEAYGGNQFAEIVQVGAALEILHTAMLIHDDIIDRDLVRYGIDNIAGQYQKIYGKTGSIDATHFATSAAILAGDYCLSAAYQIVLETGFTNGQKSAAQTLLADTIFHVIGGELIDTDAALYNEAETDPLDIAAIKTAHYSFITPLLMGAVLAGASEVEIGKLTEFGMQLGVAYQLADDLLGVFGDEELTGKSNLSDIREGKRTWMAQTAFSKSNKKQKTRLHALYGNHAITENEAREVRRIIADCGAKQASEALIDDYARKAQAAIRSLSISQESREAYTKLIDQSVKRNK